MILVLTFLKFLFSLITDVAFGNPSLNLTFTMIKLAWKDNLYNPFQPSVAFHRVTSYLICHATQMTDFDNEYNTGLIWAKVNVRIILINSASQLTSVFTMGILASNELKLCE